MSYAVCRMQKMKSPALKGIQFHNQREKESLTNGDINRELTHKNYDLVNDGNIDYNERVKNIIDSQKTSTRKTRKDAVLVNELLITSDKGFFDKLDEDEQKRFFEMSHEFFVKRYGAQNIAYATVHNDEKTPHMHLGVVPMKDGRLQGKNVFNRTELRYIQEMFPKYMSKIKGFDIERGEKGSKREHVETSKFKQQTLKKEIELLEKNLAVKKDEMKSYVENVESDFKVPAKRQTRNVEVPTGEKTIFGKDKTKTEQRKTGNIIVSEKNFKRMYAAAKENDKLKKQINAFMNTDLSQSFTQLSKEHDQLKNKHKKLLSKHNENVNDYNELLEENSTLRSRVKDLSLEINSIYRSVKTFLKERTDSKSKFKDLFSSLTSMIKEKSPSGLFQRLERKDKQKERDNGMSL